ncbi:hypothetical protein O181_024580 [Austropuccinia psidii MF-1]|uniref:Uncharacterized protein n=1 Tax=Austropuccinia psidii MF-1 TaxID=1389203 RepID=A0A9Q3CKT8_9BASI|nr:hypothetical protein [Austropuccinia psidii MF-1]
MQAMTILTQFQEQSDAWQKIPVVLENSPSQHSKVGLPLKDQILPSYFSLDCLEIERIITLSLSRHRDLGLLFEATLNLDCTSDLQPDSPIGLYIGRCRLCISTLEFNQVSDLARILNVFCPINHDRGGQELIMSYVTPLPGIHPLSIETNSMPLRPSHHNHIMTTRDPLTLTYIDFADIYSPDYHKSANSLQRLNDIGSSYINEFNPSLTISPQNHPQSYVGIIFTSCIILSIIHSLFDPSLLTYYFYLGTYFHA